MKILYAVQGTGNGHVSRARSIVPELKKYGKTDILLSGYQVDVAMDLDVKYRVKGLSFIFGRKGGISIYDTAKKLHPLIFMRDIRNIPVEEYDLVVNDFEPVTAWACRLKKKPCFGLSHQGAVLHPHAPRPESADIMGRFILRHYAPVDTCCGFHFQAIGDQIFPPVIRDEVLHMAISDQGHYTVYLPAYDDHHLLDFFLNIKNAQWQIFSKHNQAAFQKDNVSISKIDNASFLRSLSSCRGALMGAGFEGPAEALYLQKKLMVIPMKGQYEQHCNAASLQQLGVPVIPDMSKSNLPIVEKWVAGSERVSIRFPQDTATRAVAKLMDLAASQKSNAVLI